MSVLIQNKSSASLNSVLSAVKKIEYGRKANAAD